MNASLTFTPLKRSRPAAWTCRVAGPLSLVRCPLSRHAVFLDIFPSKMRVRDGSLCVCSTCQTMTAMIVRHARRRNLPAVSRRYIAGHTICLQTAECGSSSMSKATRVTCCSPPPFQESQQGLPTILTLRILCFLLFEWLVMSAVRGVQCRCNAGKSQADADYQRLGYFTAMLHMHKTSSWACDIGSLPCTQRDVECQDCT